MKDITVYTAVDVSGSMAGPKIKEVCRSLFDIITDCPDDVLFDITLFSSNTWKIVSALKSAINCSHLVQQIESSSNQGGMTALYDAWGNMLTSIPEAVLNSSIVYIFVLTDGADNASKRYTLESVEQLTKKILQNRDAKFNFIQCGETSNAGVLKSLEAICASSSSRMQSQVVDDSAHGIKTAMTSVRKEIMLSTQSRKTSTPTSKLSSSKFEVKANAFQSSTKGNQTSKEMLTTRQMLTKSGKINASSTKLNESLNSMLTTKKSFTTKPSTSTEYRTDAAKINKGECTLSSKTLALDSSMSFKLK